MYLVETFLEQNKIKILRKFNIRTVEQLLEIENNRKKIYELSELLDISFQEMVELIKHLKQTLPDVQQKPPHKRNYHTGYRIDGVLMKLVESKIKK